MESYKNRIVGELKSMKKLIRTFFVLCMCVIVGFQGTMSVSAQEQYVPMEVIVERLGNICEAYDVAMEVISCDDSVQYTIEEVEEELTRFEEGLKQYEKVHYVYGNTSTNNARVMELEKNYTSYGYADNGITGGAQIEITCVAKINLGAVEFMSIKNIETRQYGIATNFVDWTQIDSGYSYLEGGRYAEVFATGTLVTELDILGIKNRQTFDHIIVMTINAAAQG